MIVPSKTAVTVYAITLGYCVTEEYPLDTEQRREIRDAVALGDFSALTATRTESFRYYLDDATGEPVFLSHTLESGGLAEENAAPTVGPVNAPATNGATPVEAEPAEPVVLKYYNYFVEHHPLVDNRVFTVNENTLQGRREIYFAFMNTEPAGGKAGKRPHKETDRRRPDEILRDKTKNDTARGFPA